VVLLSWLLYRRMARVRLLPGLLDPVQAPFVAVGDHAMMLWGGALRGRVLFRGPPLW